jgi:tight adherence protein C
VVQQLPDLVELVALATRAGLSVHQTVEVLEPRTVGLAGRGLLEVRRRQARGTRLGDALEALGQASEHLRPLTAVLVAAERYGAPLGPALERVGGEARDLRRRRAEESARRLPVLLLFPLVLCTLPAAALLTVVPLVAASWPHLSG